jgi:NTE family protein
MARKRKEINLALQGGGAHGAFTWGVLDRLLEVEELTIAGISGTSAGALNGAALKSGWIADGRAGARANLEWLWEQVMGAEAEAVAAWMIPAHPALISRSLQYSLPYAVGDAWGRMVSPYVWGAAYRNPLEPILREFDFDKVCAEGGPVFYVCATRVRNGKIRIFAGDEITPQAIMASACLPTLFQAVEFHDAETGQTEAFWDGGYTGNPALFPLFSGSRCDDILIININPLEREEVPVTPQQIQNRINEISFNSSLLRELRAIEFVQRLLDDGTLPEGQKHRVRIHMIADDKLMRDLSVATKLVPNAQLILQLRDAGRAAAETFLDRHYDAVGERATVDLRAMFG